MIRNVPGVARQSSQKGDVVEFAGGEQSIAEPTHHLIATNAQDVAQPNTKILNVHDGASHLGLYVEIWKLPHSDTMMVWVPPHSLSVGNPGMTAPSPRTKPIEALRRKPFSETCRLHADVGSLRGAWPEDWTAAAGPLDEFHFDIAEMAEGGPDALARGHLGQGQCHGNRQHRPLVCYDPRP